MGNFKSVARKEELLLQEKEPLKRKENVQHPNEKDAWRKVLLKNGFLDPTHL